MDLGYTLLRSRRRRKTICLQLKRDGRIVIRAPFSTPKQEIDDFFRTKEEWLRQRIRERDERDHQEPPQKMYRDGQIFLFLGKSYPLRIETGNSDDRGVLLFDTQCFVLQRDDVRRGGEIFVAWYMEQAEIRLRERMDRFSRQLDLSPQGFRVTQAKSFWGSCSAENRLAFNWRLIMAPCPVIDYVIVHELQHIVEKNHSAEFWKRVAAVIPDYGPQRLWLRRNGPWLTL